MAAASSRSDQRLEFLGDRVLGSSIAEMLLREFPERARGRAVAAPVRSGAQGDLRRASGSSSISARMFISASTSCNRGGRKKTTILADACEAVIGALYLDGGIEAAAKFVEQYWARARSRPAANCATPRRGCRNGRRRRACRAPSYRQVERKGPDHAPVFRIAVEVQGIASGEGVGATKREAERAAAEAALQAQGIKIDE